MNQKYDLPDTIPWIETEDLPPRPGFIDVAEAILREGFDDGPAPGCYFADLSQVPPLTEIPEWVTGELREKLQRELDQEKAKLKTLQSVTNLKERRAAYKRERAANAAKNIEQAEQALYQKAS
jgi:hypothetical protein